MSCTRPLIRAETYEKYKNKKGGTSYKVEWLPRDFYDTKKLESSMPILLNHYRRVQLVPCGQCTECRLNYAREWATRCMLEKIYHKEETCFFITLTYADEYLPFHRTLDTTTGEILTGASLDKSDLQKFWKRVRKKYPNNKIMYLNCGEYGSKTIRPHYHIIVYGLPLDITRFKKIGMNEMNQPLWTSTELERLWGKGNVTIGQITWESVAYVARYTLKKANGKDKNWYAAQGLMPEFISMSQGIGKRYFEENKMIIYESDSVPVRNKKNGCLVKPPRAFDRMLREENQRIYEEIKQRRLSTGEASQKLKLNNTSLSAEEYRKQSEFITKSNFKDIRMEV